MRPSLPHHLDPGELVSAADRTVRRSRGDHLLASDQIAAIGDLPVADQTHDLIGDGRQQVRLEHHARAGRLPAHRNDLMNASGVLQSSREVVRSVLLDGEPDAQHRPEL